MAKRLTMAETDAILTLHTTGHSNREIATLLGRNRETVGKYVGRTRPETGQTRRPGRMPLAVIGTPPLWRTSRTTLRAVPRPPARQALRRTGRPATASRSGRRILAKVEQGLEAVRIHLDLLEEHGEGVPTRPAYSQHNQSAIAHRAIGQRLPCGKATADPAAPREALGDGPGCAAVQRGRGRLRRAAGSESRLRRSSYPAARTVGPPRPTPAACLQAEGLLAAFSPW